MSTLCPDVAASIDRICARHGRPSAPLRAVVRKETNGIPFGTNGRPRALFEKAKFYQLIEPSRREEAVHLGIALEEWNPHVYGDQPNTAATYALLERAAAFDRKAAWDSTSFGVGQIMGFNAVLVGYPDAEAMCRAFASIDAQSEAVFRFMDRKGIIDLLIRGNFVRAAVLLNGRREAEHGYHQELERLYREEVAASGGKVGRLALAATCPVTAAGVAVEGASGVGAVTDVAPGVTDALASLPNLPPAPEVVDPFTTLSGIAERLSFLRWRLQGLIEDVLPLVARLWAWLLKNPSVLVHLALILTVVLVVEILWIKRRVRKLRAGRDAKATAERAANINTLVLGAAA